MNPFNTPTNLTTLSIERDNKKSIPTSTSTLNYHININKFMETELTLLKNLDVTVDPYLQTQSLIEQGLLLLYGEYYTEYIQKQSGECKQNSGAEYYKYLTTGWDKNMDYNKYHSPTTLTEWADLTTQLYSLTAQIHESMKKCMSEYGCGFTYYGQQYKEIQARWQAYEQEMAKKYTNYTYTVEKLTAQQQIERQKDYELTSVIWSDAGAQMRINLARLGETHEVYLNDVGKNFMLLKKLWQKNHSLSLRLCAWPVLTQTQGITRWLMYIAYKQVQAYELKIQLQHKYKVVNSKLIVGTSHHWTHILYALKWIKLLELEEEDCINVLRQPLWSVSDPQSYKVSDQWFANSLYGLYQQCGDWPSLTQYIWLCNPLLSQQFENYGEYFAPHFLYPEDPSLVREWAEWLLFANIPHTAANEPWLEWREGVKKFVELMVKNFNGNQISTIVQVFVHEYDVQDWVEAQKQSENNLQKCQFIFEHVKQTNPVLEHQVLLDWWIELTRNEFVIKQPEQLRKSFVQLRAKLLGAPYQYGEVGNHLEIFTAPKAQWWWDESEWSRFK